MCATLCSLNRCILFSVFYVLPFGVINDDDDDDDDDWPPKPGPATQGEGCIHFVLVRCHTCVKGEYHPLHPPPPRPAVV